MKIVILLFTLSIITTLKATVTKIEINSLASCYDSNQTVIEIDNSRPVAILVHGVHSSETGFAPMAAGIAARNITPICFRYNDRADLLISATNLNYAIEKLIVQTTVKDIIIIGHSLGGLVARRSLVRTGHNHLEKLTINIDLITASTPFGGIRSSKTCDSKIYRYLSLGITKFICKKISGAKWNQLSPKSNFIKYPGALINNVLIHQKIITDEKGFCLKRSKLGYCKRKDYAFSIKEQKNKKIDSEYNSYETIIEAGHTAIVVDDYNLILDLLP